MVVIGKKEIDTNFIDERCLGDFSNGTRGFRRQWLLRFNLVAMTLNYKLTTIWIGLLLYSMWNCNLPKRILDLKQPVKNSFEMHGLLWLATFIFSWALQSPPVKNLFKFLGKQVLDVFVVWVYPCKIFNSRSLFSIHHNPKSSLIEYTRKYWSMSREKKGENISENLQIWSFGFLRFLYFCDFEF